MVVDVIEFECDDLGQYVVVDWEVWYDFYVVQEGGFEVFYQYWVKGVVQCIGGWYFFGGFVQVCLYDL